MLQVADQCIEEVHMAGIVALVVIKPATMAGHHAARYDVGEALPITGRLETLQRLGAHIAARGSNPCIFRHRPGGALPVAAGAIAALVPDIEAANPIAAS